MENNQNISSNTDIGINYQYKEKEKVDKDFSLFNKMLQKMSNIFGGLNYNEMKVKLNDLTYLAPESPESSEFDKYNQWEYKIENIGPRPEIWNQRGQEGWEMVQMTESGNIIWKRKIVK